MSANERTDWTRATERRATRCALAVVAALGLAAALDGCTQTATPIVIPGNNDAGASSFDAGSAPIDGGGPGSDSGASRDSAVSAPDRGAGPLDGRGTDAITSDGIMAPDASTVRDGTTPRDGRGTADGTTARDGLGRDGRTTTD